MDQEPDVVPDIDVLDSDIEIQTVQGVRPGTDANVVLQLVIGVLGTALVMVAVSPLAGTRFKYLYALMRERGPIQYIELFMAFMTITLVALKIKILRTQMRVMAETPVDTRIDLNDDVQIQDLRKQIVNYPLFSQSIVLSRMDRILAMWLEQKDVARISNWASAESARDSASSDSSYSLVRTLIWAIPILGFIGTVQGLGYAISGFSDFLGGAADLSQIKDAIANVTVGLSTAFDTTFLALILVTLLMFPLSSLQKREENLFVDIDIYLDDNLISRFPSPESKPIVIENLEDSIEAAFRRYIPDPDRYDEVFTRSIEKAAGTVEEQFAALIKNYEVALRDLSGRLSESLTTVGESMETSMHKIAEDVRSQEEAMIDKRREIGTLEVENLKRTLSEVNSAAAQVAEEYRKNAENIQAATRESADKSLTASAEISKRVEEITRLAAGIEDLLKIEQAVEKGLAGIASSTEFQSTLKDLREHLAATDAFCNKLSKPRVITLREEVG